MSKTVPIEITRDAEETRNIDTWVSATQQVLDVGLIPQWNHFQVLPSSPAGKVEYQQKWEMTVEKLFIGGSWGSYCTSTYSKSKKTWLVGMILGDVSAVIMNHHPNWLNL